MIQLGIGVAFIAASAHLASDFLYGPELASIVRTVEPNTLTFHHDDLLDGAEVHQELTPDSETITIKLDGVATFATPAALISYESHGFAAGDSWSCTQSPGNTTAIVTRNEEPSRLVFEAEDAANEIVCSRDSGFQTRDRQGEVYLFPTDFVLVTEYATSLDPLVYEFEREVRVPDEWSYENDQSTVSMSAERNSTYRGTEGSTFEGEERSQTVVETTSDRAAPMRFTDGDAEEAAERSAWIAALVAGLGSSVGMNGILQLPGALSARFRDRVSR